MKRVLPGPIERVWSYLTDSEKRGRWFAAGPMELRAGGSFEFTFNHANLSSEKETPERWKSSEGAKFPGKVTRCEPPRVLAITWENPDGGSEVVFELSPQGRDVLLKIDVQGAAMIKLAVPSAVLIFLAPPDVTVLERRIRARGGSDDADVQRRLDAATRELACIPGYDYLVINRPGHLRETVDQLETIMRAERYRVGVAPVAV